MENHAKLILAAALLLTILALASEALIQSFSAERSPESFYRDAATVMSASKTPLAK